MMAKITWSSTICSPPRAMNIELNRILNSRSLLSRSINSTKHQSNILRLARPKALSSPQLKDKIVNRLC